MTWFTGLMLTGFYTAAMGGALRSHGAWLFGVGVIAALAAVAGRRRPIYWHPAVAVAWLVFGALLGVTTGPDERALFTPGKARVELDTWRTACGSDSCLVEATLAACIPVDPGACPATGVLVSATLPEEPALGARVQLLAQLGLRAQFQNPSSTIAWPDSRPAVRVRAVPGETVHVLTTTWPSRAVRAARVYIREAFARSLKAPHDGIARALILGEAPAVDRELNGAIRRSGVSHVLAVSGMHVTVLVGALVVLFRTVVRRTRLAASIDAGRMSAWLGVFGAPCVAWLCGGSPSAVRAALTSTLMFLLKAMGRRPAPMPVAAFAIVLYALASPRDAVHPGFVLSVLATAALLADPVEGTAGLRSAARESLRAWLATLPMLLLCFGETSLVALIANVFLLPVGTLLIPLVVVHLAAVMLHVDDVLPTAFFFEITSGAFAGASRMCAAIDPGLVVPPLDLLQLVGLTLLCGGSVFAVGRARWSLIAVGLFAVACGEWRLRHPLAAGEVRVTYLDVGQGDAALVETYDGRVALIDGGGETNGADPGKLVLLPALRARRVSRIDLLVLSHGHPDHYGGLMALLDTVKVEALWDAGQALAEDPDGIAAKLVREFERRGARLLGPAELCGRATALGPVTLRVLAPCPAFDAAFDANDNSLVVRMDHGRRRFLFAGDIEQGAETELVKLPHETLVVDVLKVPHHGSRTSSTHGFLRAVAPWLAVVSCGAGNRYGHPHAEVWERLTAIPRHALRTDQHGGVQVVSDGDNLRVTAFDSRVELAREAD